MSKKSKIKKVLTIRINQHLTEDETSLGLFNKEKIPLRPFLQGLKKASQSMKYDIVLINIEQIESLGWSVIQNLRRILLLFKKESVLILSFLESGSIKEYYLASVANEIILTPAGHLELIGFRAEVFFLKEGLDNLGIGVDLIKTGDYKTFGDMFTRKSMSEPHRMMIEKILDSYMQEVAEGIQISRPNLKSSFQEIIDQAPFTAKEALDSSIVDHLMYEEEIEDFLKERFQVKKCVKIPLKLYDSYLTWRNFFKPAKKIALIYARGNIIEKEKRGILPNQNAITSKKIIKDIRRASKSKSVKAIVLRVNSPGGSALASDIIWNELRKTKKTKPIIVSMSNVAASGGYYISMGCDYIFAESMTLTGSIGVIGGKIYFTELLNKLGIHRDVVVRGKRADMLSPTAPFTPEEREKLEEQIVSFYYKQFVEKAAEGRKKDYDSMERLAQGRVWTGRDGKEHGLIDELGGLLEALDEAKKRAHIKKNDKLKYLIFPKKRFKLSLMSLIQETFVSYFSARFINEEPIQNLLDWQYLYRKNESLYLMPPFLKID